MAVYIKKVSTKDTRFTGRNIEILAGNKDIDLARIPVPDIDVICNGCNDNIYPDDGWLVYLGKRELKSDLPYDFYCGKCCKSYFPKAMVV
jgi:hypothetical protein